MAIISDKRKNVTSPEIVFTSTEDQTVITAVVICGVSSDCLVDVYQNDFKLLSQYPVPQKGTALAEIEGQMLNAGETIRLVSDNPANIRITARYTEI